MSFIEHIERRFTTTMQVLGLSPSSARVLHALTKLDLEGVEHPDLHGRQGILSWQVLIEHHRDPNAGVAALEEALVHLADWGLVQVVGRSAADPRLTGSSAVRLTHAGRVCIGLAPHPSTNFAFGREPLAWTVYHHANREGLLVACEEFLPGLGFRPIQATGDNANLDHLCGQIAIHLVTRGGAVVDAFGVSEADRVRDLPELIWRTRAARAPRILLLPEPTSVRVMAVATGARLIWKEPKLDFRRESNDQDSRITTALVGSEHETEHVADAYGVPKSKIAQPKRVSTSWKDLIVSEAVRVQLEQALMHARFRLNELPDRSGFVGKGGGYRLLLSGLPGTGKSMAAEALATKLSRPVVKLDLSSVLSKWLGETEQMIGQVFDMAEASNAVLVLDEAEALFRQRQSGGSSGSNAMLTAVAYLLTRLDRFVGVLVATTNRTQDIDDALFRRFDDFIILPIPDHDTRALLWKQMLACGLDSPMTEKELDLLAYNFVIAGGLIRGAAIRANAWAHGLGRPVAMPIVLAALARELEKSDHPTSNVLMPPYREEVAELLQDKRYPGSF